MNVGFKAAKTCQTIRNSFIPVLLVFLPLNLFAFAADWPMLALIAIGAINTICGIAVIGSEIIKTIILRRITSHRSLHQSFCK